VIIRHNNGFISVYKHASSLTVSQGDNARTGEVIAFGWFNWTGINRCTFAFPELWKEGYPIDPSIFIEFE